MSKRTREKGCVCSLSIRPFPVMKELNAKWLVGLFYYTRGHPHLLVIGFIRAGITAAFDGGTDSAMHLGMESNIDDEDSDCSDNVGFDSSDSEAES